MRWGFPQLLFGQQLCPIAYLREFFVSYTCVEPQKTNRPSSLCTLSLLAMLFTTVLLALAAAIPVFSAPVPYTELTRRDTLSTGAPHYKAAKRPREPGQPFPNFPRPRPGGQGDLPGGTSGDTPGGISGGVSFSDEVPDDEEGSSTIPDLLPKL